MQGKRTVTVLSVVSSFIFSILCVFRASFMFIYPKGFKEIFIWKFCLKIILLGAFENDPLSEFIVFEIPTFLLLSLLIYAIYSWQTVMYRTFLFSDETMQKLFLLGLFFVWCLWIVVTIVYAEVILGLRFHKIIYKFLNFFIFSKQSWNICLCWSCSHFLFWTRIPNKNTDYHLPVHHHCNHFHFDNNLFVLFLASVQTCKASWFNQSVCDDSWDCYQFELFIEMYSFFDYSLCAIHLFSVHVYHIDGDRSDSNDYTLFVV